MTFLKFTVSTLPVLPCLVAGAVYAHGLHETNAQTAYVTRSPAVLDFFIRELHAEASMRVDERRGYRYIESDGMPDHATGRFPNAHNPNRISQQKYAFRLRLKPRLAGSATPVEHSTFGVASNGVPFDPATAEYWNDDPDSGWNIDAIGSGVKLGLDQNHAHVQPNGAYHYHGIPVALMERGDQFSKPLMLGFAADGFPIYGPYSWQDPNDMSSELINLYPSYRVKQGTRPGGPGGTYDGRYTADYAYIEGLGDLDECNGRRGVTPEYPGGTYYYVITDSWPFIPRCWMGKPDKSFAKGPQRDAATDEKKTPRAARPRPSGALAPPEATRACVGARPRQACYFRAPQGLQQGTCRNTGQELICVPDGRGGQRF